MLRHAQRGFSNLHISKIAEVPKLIFGPLPLGEKGSYKSTTVSLSVGQYVSMSVGEQFLQNAS